MYIYIYVSILLCIYIYIYIYWNLSQPFPSSLRNLLWNGGGCVLKFSGIHSHILIILSYQSRLMLWPTSHDRIWQESTDFSDMLGISAGNIRKLNQQKCQKSWDIRFSMVFNGFHRVSGQFSFHPPGNERKSTSPAWNHWNLGRQSVLLDLAILPVQEIPIESPWYLTSIPVKF